MITLSGDEYRSLLPKRPEASHKGTFGVAGIVAGSVCYQGAACLASKAALMSGAGVVCAFIPGDIYIPFASKIYGAVTEPLASENGGISDDTLCEKILKRKCTALLCGSGLGLTDGAKTAVKDVARLNLPIIFDGDGITALSENKELLSRKGTTFITSHIGEFSRLCGKSIDEIKKDRYNLASDFSKTHDCIVILKDSETVIALPSGKLYSLDNPTSALSKGGSGDVLAGMLCSFAAQGIDAETASVCAVTLHNACGHDCKKRYGEYSVLAEDIADSIRRVL